MSRLSVGVGISTERATEAATREAVRLAMGRAGLTRAAWAVCFFTPQHLSQADIIRRVLMDESGCLTLSGCSASGVIGTGREVEGSEAIGVMVGASNAFETRSALLDMGLEGVSDFFRAPSRDEWQGVLLAMPDAFRIDAMSVIRRLSEGPAGLDAFGGGATDDGTLGLSLQLGMEGVRSSSLALHGFYGDIKHFTGITQSCLSVGDPHFITNSSGNILKELDGRPAMQALIDIGKQLGLDSMQEVAEQLLFGFPLDPENPEFIGESCLVRPLMGFDQESQGLIIPHEIQPHGTVGFMHRNPIKAEADLDRMLIRLGRDLGGVPDFGFYFNCSARGQTLYGRGGVDVRAIHEHLGEFPLLGMFGGYEI
ncbi:MAG: FIST C-terminal domain-containing protein, partial [Deltaproteobacteria bacterium]|nr:FIST C-terminal domain-containing protein [Deltaproteobacteria bacterium]